MQSEPARAFASMQKKTSLSSNNKHHLHSMYLKKYKYIYIYIYIYITQMWLFYVNLVLSEVLINTLDTHHLMISERCFLILMVQSRMFPGILVAVVHLDVVFLCSLQDIIMCLPASHPESVTLSPCNQDDSNQATVKMPLSVMLF